MELPTVALDLVFSYLTLPDRKSVSLVCKAWNAIAFNRGFLKRIKLDLNSNWDQSVVDRFRASSRCYQNVCISYWPMYDCSELDFAVIIEILDLFGEEVDYLKSKTTFTEDQLWNVIIRVPNIRELIVHVNASFLKHDRSFPALRILQDKRSSNKAMPKLLQLGANSTSFTHHPIGLVGVPRDYELFSVEFYFSTVELRFPKLEVLELTARQRCPDNNRALWLFFNAFQCLKDVKLEFYVNDRLLDVLTQTCSGIESLKLKLLDPTSDTFQLLERLKNLWHLSIIASLDRNIALVGKPLVSVKRFVLKLNNETKIIEGSRQVLPNVDDISIEPETNGFLENICENFPHLRRLTIPKSKIEGSTMSQNFRHMDQLEELILPTAYFQANVMLPIRCLKRLVLTNVDWFFDEDLILLAELYPNLKYLELTRGYRITATGIEAFRSRLPDCVVNILENMYPLF